MRVLLLTPPMTQINTPYPATAYLTGFLRGRGYDAVQADPGLELLLRLLSREGLEAIGAPPQYVNTVEAVVRFLQGNDPTLAYRIVSDDFLPRGPRFVSLEQYGDEGLDWAFGSLGIQDRAQHLASLYVDDLADLWKQEDPRFELSRYGEKLALAAASFDPILNDLKKTTLVDRYLDEIAQTLIAKHKPDVVGFSIPFPGNVYGAFRMAQVMKRHAQIVFGGGYVNTELRDLKDPRVFDFVDYITLDDGERPLLQILDGGPLLRTLVRENGKVALKTTAAVHDIPFKDAGTPTYDGLPTGKYLSMCELLNPMHRLWSDGRWNKLTIAHGCYWKKCTFCDTSLDYIGRYETQAADGLVDRIETLVKETGTSGFHFVDEAAPPKALEALAKRLIERNVIISWWGNIRFEKTFTPQLCRLLAQSGCVAISGGLEVASDRLLKLMQKGVTVEQVARVTKAFTDAGIMVHAYLMYGFPTQTEQETIDSLERVRQLFNEGCLQSAYWHRFACTVHSPVGLHPEKYGIKLLPVESTFARNDIAFEDSTGVDHDAFQPGLRKALYNFMHGMGLDEDVRRWFDFSVPKAKVPRTLISGALDSSRAARRSSETRGKSTGGDRRSDSGDSRRETRSRAH